MKNLIRKKLEELSQLEKITNEAEKKYMEYPDDADVEKAFDEAYEKEFEMYLLVSSEISVFSGISDIAAKKMVMEKRNELVSLFA